MIIKKIQEWSNAKEETRRSLHSNVSKSWAVVTCKITWLQEGVERMVALFQCSFLIRKGKGAI